MTVQILKGDCRDVLRTLPAESVHCVVTSPPYWGLRDYGIPPSIWSDDQNCEHVWGETISVNATNHTTKARWNHTRNGRDELQPTEKRVSWLRTEVKQGQFCQRCGAWAGAFGLEPTYQLYVDDAVEVFREVHRVLRPDGTLWLNLGDNYNAYNGGAGPSSKLSAGAQTTERPKLETGYGLREKTLKPKDLCGIPWRVAFALQSDGWWLRSDIIWSKPNPMPESITDRPTKAHEYLFLLAKSERYFYDAEAIKEKSVTGDPRRPYTSEGAWQLDGRPIEQRHGGQKRKTKVPGGWDTGDGAHGTIHRNGRTEAEYVEVEAITSRNRRSVWSIPTAPFAEAHFATFPPDLVDPCIKAGCPAGGTVLDPFGGAGTVGLVADRLKRNAILIELNPEYADMAERRISGDGGMFASVEVSHGT